VGAKRLVRCDHFNSNIAQVVDIGLNGNLNIIKRVFYENNKY